MERVGRDRTIGQYHLDMIQGMSLTPDGMPTLDVCDTIPDDLTGMNYALADKSHDGKACGVHFFLDDYQIQRVWADPESYGRRLSRYQCVLTPDFSLYRDMPLPMQEWNVYRSRMVGSVWQRMGLKVVPTLQWSTPDTYAFAFDGLQEGGVYAVSTVGVLKDRIATLLFKAGLSYAVERLHPSTLLVYGKPVPGYDIGCDWIRYDNHVIRRLENGR